MIESVYQRQLMNKLEMMFPGCYIVRNDPNWRQGFPDLLILWQNQWAALEVKISDRARHQPNQDHYIDSFNQMSFAAFIHPQNEEQVLHDLQSAFGFIGEARVS